MPTPQELQQYQQLLNQFMPRQQQGITLGGLTSPQGLLGLGLLGGSFLGKEEPGYVTEARQNIRNVGTPTGYGNVFGQTVGGLQSQFQPLLQQQAERGIADVSQRFKAAFPATVGMQGSQVAGLERYLREQLVPTQQAFLGNLGLQGINQQQQANTKILELDRPDPFKEALSQLGGALILGTNQGGGTFGGGGFNLNGLLGGGQQGTIPGSGGGGPGNLLGGQSNIGQNIGNLLNLSGGNFAGGSFPAGIEQSLNPAMATQLVSGLQAAFPSGTFAEGFGGLEPLGNGMFAVTQSSGQAVGVFNPSTGMVTNLSTGATTALPQTSGLTGFLGGTGGTMSGLLGIAGAGLAGFGAGNFVGGLIPESRAGGTAGGAAAGAAAGAIMGSILPGIGTAIGAVIGGIAGAAGGFGGSRGVDHQAKAERLAADISSQDITSQAVGKFWLGALAETNYQDIEGFQRFINSEIAATGGPSRQISYGGVSGNYDQPDSIAAVGGRLLLQEIQKASPQYKSLDDVPSLRSGYISYLLENTRIGSGGGVSRPSSIQQKGSLVNLAGFSPV